MIRFSVLKYYFYSVISLFKNFNFWLFPFLLIKKPLLIKVKNSGNYYVSNFMDIWTLKETLIDQQYEMFNKVKKGDLVIDVGAAIGDFSISVSKRAKKVIAYECDKERLSLMEKNIKLHRAKNIVIKDKKALSLNQILQQAEQVDFLKVDCEGCEYQIFKNASKKTLNKIQYLAMEAHLFNPQMQANFSALTENLKKNNLQVKIVNNQVHDYICYVFAERNKQLSGF